MTIDPNVEKALFAAAGGLIVWAMTLLSTYVKSRLQVRRSKQALIDELKDILKEIELQRFRVQRLMQIGVHGAVEFISLPPLSNLYFRQYYKELHPHLTRAQRISFQTIHSMVDAINGSFVDLREELRHFQKEMTIEQRRKLIAHWVHAVDVIFDNLRSLQWHISFHLANPGGAAFDVFSSAHDELLKYLGEAKKEAKAIKEKAKTMKLADFEIRSAE